MKRHARPKPATQRRKPENVGAPAAQQNAVVADGQVVRLPRVRLDGVVFIRSNPIAHLYARGSANRAQRDAAARFERSWEEGGRGVGPGSSLADIGTRGSAAPQTGVIPEPLLARLRYQIGQQQEFEAAVRWVGAAQAKCLRAVVLEGRPINAWAAAEKRDRQEAKGYVLASLDRLAEFYAQLRRAEQRRQDKGGR